MLGRIDGRRFGVVTLLGVALVGCGGGESEDTAREKPQFKPASEEEEVFVERLAKLIETTSARKDCAEIEEILRRSLTTFSCPAETKFRKSMRSFEIVGAADYGTGAIVDYKSGDAKKGAAIVLFVTEKRNWAVSRFGIVTAPSTKTSDDQSRGGYDKVVDDYLAAVRERDCKAFRNVAFAGATNPNEVCDGAFAATKQLAQRLKASPSAEPKYLGGNATYGFYGLETQMPTPANSTISVLKVPGDAARESGKPYVVLDVAPSPTAADQRFVIEEFRRQQREGSGNQPETSPSRKAS